MEEFIRLRKIGEGTYGIVYEGKSKKSGETVAIKKIRMENEEEGIPGTAIREISLLKLIEHPNVVSLLKIILQDESIYLIFEHLSMDLKRFLDTKVAEKKYLDPLVIKSYMYQIVQGISFCHKEGVIHRDLKPQNLLINSKGTIKVADFGLARTYSIPVRPYTTEVVTLWYRAPEILLGTKHYCCPIDIWSIGCIFAEMALLKPLFCGNSEIEQLFQIFRDTSNEHLCADDNLCIAPIHNRILTTPNEENWPGVSKFAYYQAVFPNWKEKKLALHIGNRLDSNGLDLLQLTLTYNPSERIAARSVLNHPYFAEIRRKENENLFYE